MPDSPSTATRALPALLFATLASTLAATSASAEDRTTLPATDTPSISTPDAPAPLRLAAVENPLSNEIIVTGRYLANEKFSATKVPTPVIDVPQALSITTEEQITEQAFRDIGDILRFVPGAAVAQGEGHRDQITLRGQNTTADFFLDGIRDDVQYFRPLYNLEQVEILRGANALIFGRGGGGGVVNRVTKRPDYDTTFGSATLSADTFGSGYLAGDLNAAVSDTAAFRLNAFAETLDNHRDFFEGERVGINPTFAFEAAPGMRVDLSYEFLHDDRVVDRGVPSVAGAPLEGFDATFFGDPDLNETELTAHIFRARLDKTLSNTLAFNATVHYADYDKLYQNIFPIGIDLSVPTVSLDGYRDATDRQNLIVQANLVGEFDIAGIGNTLLVGAETGQQVTDNSRRDALFAASRDDQITTAFSDPLRVPALSFPAFNRLRDSDVAFNSLYIQNQIELLPQLQIVAGLRWDDFSIDVGDAIRAAAGESGDFNRSDDRVSPRIGAIYKPRENISLYGGYSQSFLPRAGDQFLTLTPTTESLAPEEFRNYEAGLKWDIRPDLFLSTAVFQLDREAGTVVDPTDVGNTLLVGSRTRGFEAELSGRLTDAWTLNAGYSYLDAQERGRVAGDILANRTLPIVPEHMAFVWSRYNLTDRFGVGAGATYQDAQFASISNAVELPDFVRVDAALYFQATDAIALQLNVENLLDTDYFPAAHNDNNISTGEPLNARLSVSSTF